MATRNACCSFCRKNYRDVGPLVEGPDEVYICGECVELCQSIIDQEKQRRGGSTAEAPSVTTPEALRARLDQLVAGQEEAKRALVLSAQCRAEPGGKEVSNRVLLVGPSRASKVLLLRALAHSLDVPFAEGDASTLLQSCRGTEEAVLLAYELLLASDFSPDQIQRGIVYVDGVDRPEAAEPLLRLWDGWAAVPGPLSPDPAAILFVCGGTFAGLDEVIAHLGRHPEQPVTGDVLVAWGLLPELVMHLQSIARVAALDEDTLARILPCVDFSRMDSEGKGA
jgi:ATP-dependent Clp protease ATP-binding subunit ClpX